MNDFIGEGEAAQVTTTYRCRHYFESNHFKHVQHTTVSLMYKYKVYALREDKKFLRFRETEDSTTELDTLRHNMLCTTMNDEPIESSMNNTCILQPLLDAFYRHYLIKAEESYRKNRVE